MGEVPEQPLTGGAQTRGLVKVGVTVRRPSYPRAHFVDALLRHLEAVGFAGAPRVLGYDDQGRQVLTFIDGTVPHLMPFNLSDEQLLSAAELVLAFHDAMATSPLCDGQEVVCHGDLGPHNTVFRGPRAVAIIDWDSDVRPGRRADDFAHAVWCFADLTEAAVPVAEQARRTRLMCSAYPNMTPGIVVAELIDRFQRARDQHATAGRVRATEVFDRLLGWMATYGEELATSR